ncbi:MAG: tetratricopeptide repeat protein, partial [Candidatus Binatia bacterium]
MEKSCNRVSAIDLAAFIIDPHDPDFPDFAAFRQHYPGCAVCTAEVAKWTRLGQLIQESSENPVARHPGTESLRQFRHRRGNLPAPDRQALEQHLQTCAGCREELSLLNPFDFRRIQQWEFDVKRETAQEQQQVWIERSRALFVRLFDGLRSPGWQPVFAAAATLLLGFGIGQFLLSSGDESPPSLQQILQEPDRSLQRDAAVAGEPQRDDVEEAQRLTQQMLQFEQQGKYAEAVPLARQAVIIYEKVRGAEHPDTATALDSLASLYREMGEYTNALPLAQRASTIREKVLGAEHPDTATSLNNLALIYRDIGNYAQALALFQRSVTISEKALGPKHSRTAIPLSNLASLYQAMDDYAQALPLFQRALAIREKVLGPEHPRTAITLSNLASLYQDMGDYTQALLLFQRALAIREKVLGPEHPRTATSLSSLASLYRDMKDYTRALPLALRAVAVHEKVLGAEHPHTAASLYTVAVLYRDVGDYRKALQFSERCVFAQDQV